MNKPLSIEHEFAARRLLAYAAGLLPENETLRVEDHLRDCEDCRARMNPLAPLSAADSGHLPASLIATWPRSARLLSGVARDMAASHLERCASCRESLVFAGHEPVLPAPVLATAPVPVLAYKRSKAARWSWALVLSGVAAAAAFVLFLRPAMLPNDTRTSATIAPPVTGEAAVEFDLGVSPTTPGALDVPAPGTALALEWNAGAEPAALVVVLPAALRPVAPEDGGQECTVALLQDGRELGSRSCRLDALGPAIRVRMIRSLPAGSYELRLTRTPRSGGTSEVSSYLLHVTR